MKQPTNREITTFLTNYFNIKEIKQFCFHEFREFYDNLLDGSATSKNEIIRELIGFCERRGETETLLNVLRAERGALYNQQFVLNKSEAELPQEDIVLLWIDSYLEVWRKVLDFDGVSKREEFYRFYIIDFGINLLFFLLIGWMVNEFLSNSTIFNFVAGIWTLYGLASLVVRSVLIIRRLRDLGSRSWNVSYMAPLSLFFFLIGLGFFPLAIVGLFVMFYLAWFEKEPDFLRDFKNSFLE